jgi:Kef-type K+ transport system membrane component KefB
MLFPFSAGFLAAALMPSFFGARADSHSWVLPLFLGTALSITALPVIAKILMDLGLYRSQVGVVIIASAVVNDLIGWVCFALILGMMGGSGGVVGVVSMFVLTLLFAVSLLTVGRTMIDRCLLGLSRQADGNVVGLGFVLVLTFFCAAFTDWAGTHANFGAFLCGIALGNCRNLDPRASKILNELVKCVLAPLFFACVGLRVNFVSHFDAPLVLVVLAIATASKVLGCRLGARWGGLSERDSWAVGFGMNARGAMEIILALLALEAGMIGETLFVAIVIMALATSALSGTMIPFLIRLSKPATTVRTASLEPPQDAIADRTSPTPIPLPEQA